MKVGRHSQVPAPLAVPAVAAALIALIPAWYLATEAFARGAAVVRDEIFQQRTWDLIIRSGWLTTVVTLASIIVGTAAAWVGTRFAVPARGALLVLLALPLAIPSYLTAFAWISWQPGLEGFWGAAIVLTCACYPYVMLPVAAALRGLDSTQEDVARSLGRTPRQVAWGLILPQVRPSITAGGLLVTLYVLSDFGAVAAMRYETFTWVIYGAYRAGFNPSRAAILSLVLVVAALVLVTLESRARGRAGAVRLGSGVARRRQRSSFGRDSLAGLATVFLIVAVSLGVPIASVASWMGRDTTRSVSWSAIWSSVADSFLIGLLTAIATILIALPVGIAAARYRSRFSSVVERTTYVTHALPGIVIAISVVYVGIRLLTPWYQKLPLLVLAQTLIFLPLAVGAIRNAIEQSSSRIEEVAHSLGAGTMSTIRRVTIPLALPGIGAAAALTMLNAMKELPTTLLLRPTGWETLATSIWKYSSVSDYAAIGPYALALMVVTAIPTALVSSLTVLRLSREPRSRAELS
jgi:iron(III) transport system permease protein